jgi:hypothetical protein
VGVSAQIAHADMPPVQLVGVKIWIGSTTLDGYTGYSVLDIQDMKKDNPTLKEILEFRMQQGKYVGLISGIHKVTYPSPMFISAMRPSQLIPRTLITKYERIELPFDKQEYHGPYVALPLLAQELLNRPPLFSCTEKDGWGGVQWLSYNSEWNENSMKDLCEEPKSEKAERIRKYLLKAVPDVFELRFHVD